MAALAPMGGVHLQHHVPIVAAGHPVQGRLWSGSPSIRSYEPGDTRVTAVAKSMEERAEFLADVRYRLEQAQAVQKLHYDKHHRHVAY